MKGAASFLTTHVIDIFCDGGSRGNPGPAAAAYLIKTKTNKILHQDALYLGIKTNNQAEYQAVLNALTWLSSNSHTISPNTNQVNFFLDSLLVVNQLSGKFKIKNLILRRLATSILSLIQQNHLNVKFHYIPRERNIDADSLVNQSLDAHA